MRVSFIYHIIFQQLLFHFPPQTVRCNNFSSFSFSRSKSVCNGSCHRRRLQLILSCPLLSLTRPTPPPPLPPPLHSTPLFPPLPHQPQFKTIDPRATRKNRRIRKVFCNLLLRSDPVLGGTKGGILSFRVLDLKRIAEEREEEEKGGRMGSAWRNAKRALGLNLCVHVPRPMGDEEDDMVRRGVSAEGLRASDAAATASPSPRSSMHASQIISRTSSTPTPSSDGLRMPKSGSRSSKV